jgi:acetyl esterase
LLFLWLIILLQRIRTQYAAKLKAANIAVDHTCWPGMIHGLGPSFAGVVDAGKVVIDRTGAALRKAFE